MKFETTEIKDVVKIVPKVIGDSRGYFLESFKDAWFRENVSDVTFVQDNQSLSSQRGTLRGLHFQLPPFEQGKLVRCLRGSIFDVAVDIRPESPTFKKWVGVHLTEENQHQLWMPPGFAHGFKTTSENTIVAYKVTAPYDAASDRGYRWDDPEIAIDWPDVPEGVMLSDKDRKQPLLSEFVG